MIQKAEEMLNLKEIENSITLKSVLWILIFGFALSFQTIIKLGSNAANNLSSHNYVCPSYFQNCDFLILPSTLPDSWAHNILYAIPMILVFLSAFFLYKNQITKSILAILPATLIQFSTSLFLSNSASIPFELFHTGFLLVLIFFPNKIFFLRILFIVLYFCAGLMKLDYSWIAGGFFSSMEVGLPLVPRPLIPLATNTVIIFEIFLIFFLMSSNIKLRRITFWFFIVFHLYSITLVGMRYPFHCLFILYLLFNNFDDVTQYKLAPKQRFFYIPIVFILLINFLTLSYGPDAKITYEGFRPALNMFDANRYCQEERTFFYKDGTSNSEFITHNFSYSRCNIYSSYFYLKNRCKDSNIESIVMSFNGALNGGAISKYVDTVNICREEFRHFGDNKWIAKKPIEPTRYPPLSGRIKNPVRMEPLNQAQRSPNLSETVVGYLRIFYIFFATNSLVLFGIQITRKSLKTN